jgi:hypothetical protein
MLLLDGRESSDLWAYISVFREITCHLRADLAPVDANDYRGACHN